MPTLFEPAWILIAQDADDPQRSAPRYCPISVADAPRSLLVGYFVLCLIIIPSSLITRWLELTGISVSWGSATLYLTLYVPLLFCIPLALWLGYFWGAVPAYFSTLVVALAGGMPMGWILLFSFANPIGLAVMVLIYRSMPLRVDLRGPTDLTGFVVVVFLSSLAGSSGAAIWAHTNQVGWHDLHPVWEGWWLGGLLQGALLTAPFIWLFGPRTIAWLERKGLRHSSTAPISRRQVLTAMITTVGVLIAYILVARLFGIARLNEVTGSLASEAAQVQLTEAADWLSIPLWIMAMVILLAAYFAYAAVRYWTSSLRHANQALAERAEALYQAATTDYLTGCSNRGHFLDQLASLEPGPGMASALMLLDLDHFKRINDQNGHLAGDEILVVAARRLARAVGDNGFVGRYGGEEFAVYLQCASREQLTEVAQRACDAIGTSAFAWANERVEVTASGGCALRQPNEGTDDWLHRADKALYQAKARGRNRVEWFENSVASGP